MAKIFNKILDNKNVPKPSLKDALKQCFDEFSHTNMLHVVEGEYSAQKRLHFEIDRIINYYIINPRYRSLIDFRIDSNTSMNKETSLKFVPNNLFTLILIYFYEVPDPIVLPDSGTFKNEERFDYKEHYFWFEEGEPRTVNINVDKSEVVINRFNL